VQFKRNVYRLCSFQLSYLKRERLFSIAGRVLPHARNIARAPFSVQEDLWPFALAGTMEEMKRGDRIVLGVAGLVIRGRYRKRIERGSGGGDGSSSGGSGERYKRHASGAIRVQRDSTDYGAEAARAAEQRQRAQQGNGSDRSRWVVV